MSERIPSTVAVSAHGCNPHSGPVWAHRCVKRNPKSLALGRCRPCPVCHPETALAKARP